MTSRVACTSASMRSGSTRPSCPASSTKPATRSRRRAPATSGANTTLRRVSVIDTCGSGAPAGTGTVIE